MLVLLLALGATGAGAQDGDWRSVATPADRERLREWRTAWVDGLAAARATGRAKEVAAQGLLFNPDWALSAATPPAGYYRCRLFRLGGARGWATMGWVPCQVDAGVFSLTGGPQRPTGRLFASTDGRAVLLGTLMMGDEARPMRYGRDTRRDVAAVMERVGPARWRLAFPYPRFGSTLDVVEMSPVQ